mgnify:CR=1 FL=1
MRTPLRVCAVVVCCSIDAVLSVVSANDDLPVRKAGLWRLTTVSEAVGMKTFDTCIRAKDSVLLGDGDTACQTFPIRKLGDEMYVDVVCTSVRGREKTSTVLTGDFTTWYRAMSKITFDPPSDGVSHMGVTIDGKYIGSDCTPTKNSGNNSR